MATRTRPTREEWAAKAEYHTRTACMPYERVSRRPEDWLSADEMTELRSLIQPVLKTARRHLNRLIRPIAAEFADEPTGEGWYAWHDGLTDDQRERGTQLRTLRGVRSSLNHGARRASSDYADVDDLIHGLGSVVYAAKTHVTEECPEADRLAELREALAERRDAAAHEATEEAVRREVARRQTDEAWTKQVKRWDDFDRTGGITIIRH
ncbi:hypothetical protein AB0E08_05055 [Streptomyces sp. NPDC048281]|uniref:hypothetical protein n=1 Tax=Streptomyces sp. NPDC048281 TaxID=3154715 RepID=UPI00343EB6CD